MERRLAAILVADVVGYSRLMSADEAGTLKRLKSLRKDLVVPALRNGRGRIVKLMGDGLLAEFPSVAEAVACALEIQDGLTKEEAKSPEDKRIQLRIGVNLGDVILEGSDIYGNGVNVAARLEAIADPGGICISGQTYDLIDKALKSSFADGGEQEVKNIDEAVRVYKSSAAPVQSRKAARESEPTAGAPKQSIAVLPFENMSGDPDQGYFCDGVTEDIITELSRFKELSVVSRNSSFAFKGGGLSIPDVGRRLAVESVVEGSIRKAGNRVRVTAQLIDTVSDKHIWAERYDRDLDDIFEVQDDVVRRITASLVARLAHERFEHAQRRPPGDLRAYDLYLKARELFFNWNIADNLEARKLLQTALEMEKEYAAALALLSEVQLRMFLNGWSEAPLQELDAALSNAQKAVEIDDQDSRVHTALGMAWIFHRDLDQAKHHFETALRLNPNDTRVLVYYSRQAMLEGRSDLALELCDQATVLNPFGKYAWNIGMVHFAARDYLKAREAVISIRNAPLAPLAILAGCHAMLGEAERARATTQKFFQAAQECASTCYISTQDEWRQYFMQRWPFRSDDDLNHLFDALSQAGILSDG